MDNKPMTLLEIARELSLSVLSGHEFLSREVGSVIASDLMSDVLAFSVPDALLVTALANVQSVVTANISDALGILYTRGKRPEPSAMEMAEKFELPLLGTGEDTFVVCGKMFAMGIGAAGSEESG